MGINDLEILKAACCIAAADGEITEAEREAVQVLADRAGVGRASLAAMQQMAIDDPDFFEHYLGMLKEDADQAFKTLLRVAVVDQRFGTNERVLVQYFAGKMDLTPERTNQLLDAAEREAAK
jgi:tellurite resistance protein